MKKTTDIYYPVGDIEKTFINSIWRLCEYDLYNTREIILPKGTVEIIFNFSDNIYYLNPLLSGIHKLPVVFINGINFKPFKLIKNGRQKFIGIQLKSIALKALFNLPVIEFNNKIYASDDVCPSLNALAQELSGKSDFRQQVEVILQWFKIRIHTFNNYQFQINRVQKLVCLTSGYDLTVKRLSSEICLSDRHLRRFSYEWLGMCTEEFIHYNRYLKSLHLLHSSKQTLTAIALEAGYYDQSHFIREFKSYTEFTPRQYKEANAQWPGHIIF